MVSPAPLPPNETARLASLQSYGILDTAPDERFELFTRLGTWIFGTSVCAIHFVAGETTFFKSVVGFERYEAPRITSICAHAVGLDDPIMTIPDLSQDHRFHDHPLLLKNGLRFYAGALLRSSSQHAIGTLCIGDVTPRILSEEERAKLLALASGVVVVLELHRCGIQLREAASRDVLTGLFNRRHFDMALQSSIERASLGYPFALMFLDLDEFKPINDTLGHAAGDAVLCEVSRRLQSTARRSDIVARLAGDEFVLIIADAADDNAVASVATRILAAINAPFTLDGQPIPLRCSIGITLCPAQATAAPDLLRLADLALYEAKRNGRNRFELHRPPPSSLAQSDVSLASN